MSALKAEEIKNAFAEGGIGGLPAPAYEQFGSYLDLLLRWNQRLNLTAVRDRQEVVRRHFIECAFAAQQLPAGLESLLDYGSGPGFPGIPIAICCPAIRVTLAESHAKKAAFLQEAVRVLGVNADVHAGRVETMPEDLRFDAVAMRAVEKMESAIPVAVQRAKKYLVLLTTLRLAAAQHEVAPELTWQEPIPLPNSEQMILAIGRRV